ncbi:hypothetical protein DFH07DRAFT_767014 [Mycena maculata]|uniref:Uncharacterized protein n=1 Tax=Mycena maculata TaxID=230809 RepID=A0AAD7K094_9AGAR|nr:hypothetical protein DFH07DRAFT_767014 [Mycena maculata]
MPSQGPIGINTRLPLSRGVDGVCLHDLNQGCVSLRTRRHTSTKPQPLFRRATGQIPHKSSTIEKHQVAVVMNINLSRLHWSTLIYVHGHGVAQGVDKISVYEGWEHKIEPCPSQFNRKIISQLGPLQYFCVKGEDCFNNTGASAMAMGSWCLHGVCPTLAMPWYLRDGNPVNTQTCSWGCYRVYRAQNKLHRDFTLNPNKNLGPGGKTVTKQICGSSERWYWFKE